MTPLLLQIIMDASTQSALSLSMSIRKYVSSPGDNGGGGRGVEHDDSVRECIGREGDIFQVTVFSRVLSALTAHATIVVVTPVSTFRCRKFLIQGVSRKAASSCSVAYWRKFHEAFSARSVDSGGGGGLESQFGDKPCVPWRRGLSQRCGWIREYHLAMFFFSLSYLAFVRIFPRRGNW
jgi:hypothetical protein